MLLPQIHLFLIILRIVIIIYIAVIIAILILRGKSIMKMRNVAELHNKTTEILREVKESGYVIITSHGKPTALIKKFSEEEIEDFVIENYPLIRKSILNSYDDYVKNGGIDTRK